MKNGGSLEWLPDTLLRLPSRLALTLLLFNLAGWTSPAGAGEAGMNRLRTALTAVRFVAYTPRAFRPSPTGPPAPVPATAIASDLDLLRADFEGLITYTTSGGMEALPALAAARGFRAVVLGIWDPKNREELDRALGLARRFPDLVTGLAIGNEGLFAGRYTLNTLLAALELARQSIPDLPLSTSEPFAVLLSPPPGLLDRIDFLMPNIHPLTEPWFAAAPETAAWEMVENVIGQLRNHGKPILVKETGLPSAPASAGLSPERQARFWRALRKRLPPGPERAVAAFEAFDAPWKPEEIARTFTYVPPGEAHWGFFTASGEPKPVLDAWRQGR